MAKKKEKKAGKRMKKKELVKVLLEFFHTKQDEVLSLKYIFEQLHLTTHPLKMLCMDILSELSMDDYITEVDRNLPAQEQRQEFLYTGRWRRTDIRGRTQLGTRHEQ